MLTSAVHVRRLAAASRTRLLARHLCAGSRYTRATAGNEPLLADENELWVSYADTATIRKQLIGVAQQVRGSLQTDPLPELVIPQHERVRHGFWFMRFSETEHRDAAITQLNGTPFKTECGSFSGELQLDAGTRPCDARAMLCLLKGESDEIRNWLHRRFAPHGTITSLTLPRLNNEWDQGLAFIRFSHPDEADTALEALDGTPSPIVGCNMFIDYKVSKPLREVASNPVDIGHVPPKR